MILPMGTQPAETILIFTNLRGPLIILSVTILLNFIALIFLNKKVKVNQLALINLIMVFWVIVSILSQSSVIANRFGLAGDPFSFYLALLSSLIFLVALFLFSRNSKRKVKKEENDKKIQ